MRSFADAERPLLGPVDQSHLQLRHFGEAQDRVVGPIARSELAIVVRDRFVQRPARRLHHAAFDLVAQPVGIDHQARVGRGPRARHAHFARARIHQHFRDHRAIHRQVLVLGEGDAASAQGPAAHGLARIARVGRRCSLPVRHRGDAFDHRAPPRVLQVREAEGDRVGARRAREFVHEGLRREHVGVRA